VGTTGDSMIHTRWSNSMAGEEYARIYSWGNDPKRKVSVRNHLREHLEDLTQWSRGIMNLLALLSPWICHRLCLSPS
jgi:hypothetical protein